MSTPHRARPVVSAVLVVLALAGCTTTVRGHGSSAVGGGPARSGATPSATPALTASDVVARARNTMTAAGAITVRGGTTVGGTAQRVDIRVGYGDDEHYLTEGHTVVTGPDGSSIEQTGVGLTTWVKAPAAYWEILDLPAATVATLDGHWVKAPHELRDDDVLVTLRGLTRFLLPASDDIVAFTPAPRGGTDVVALTAAQKPGATFVFRSGDQPRLVEIVYGTGSLPVTYPDGQVTVEAPDPSQVVTLPGD